MDPASLGLGVLPLVVGAIKSYSSLKKKLDVFRHYSREIHRLRKRFDVERRLFLNETHILVLTALEDYSLVAQMFDDPDDPQWFSKTAEAAFRTVLADSYDEYSDAVSGISETIQGIHTELASFSCFERVQHENETLKETIFRNRDRVKITSNKAKLEESLDELNESNGNLQRLGEQTRKIKEIKAERTVFDGLRKRLPQEYADFGMVRRASKAFHSALANAWSSQTDACQRLAIRQHNVRVFLDTKVLDSVSMDVVVECPGHLASSSLFVPRPLRLQVKSQVMQWGETGLQSPPASTSPDAEDSQLKRRRVRFQDEEDHQVSTVPPTEQFQPKLTKNLDIPNLLSRDICQFLQHTCSGHTLDKCVGYLDSCCDEIFRHSIYPCLAGAHNLQTPITIDKVLDVPVDTNVSTVDQLNLARSLVAAVLKFHSTPWLAQYLTLRDILLFQSSTDFTKCLQTLHFDTSFQYVQVEDTQTVEATPDASFAGTPSQDNTKNALETVIENAKLDHGIRNMTLWCLGVILLQIGQWSCLAEPDNVREVRRRSWKRTGISPKYDELTRRCLNCDFGYGEDLTRPRLQQAVYEKVYCELVSMIDSMTISED